MSDYAYQPKVDRMPGAQYGEVYITGEEKLPCAILLDVSGSMEENDSIGQLRQGVEELRAALNDDDHCINSVETTIITFNEDVTIVDPFKSCTEMSIPFLKAEGLTSMYTAVDVALDEMDNRKRDYRAAGTTYKRGWIFLLTDGLATDEANRDRVLARLKAAEDNKSVTFFAVAIGSADKDELARMSQSHVCLTADRNNFKSCFKWLSASMSAGSRATGETKTVLPDVTQTTNGDVQIHQISIDF